MGAWLSCTSALNVDANLNIRGGVGSAPEVDFRVLGLDSLSRKPASQLGSFWSPITEKGGLEKMLNTKKIRILAVDDHPLLREGIAKVINGEEDMQLVGDAANGREVVELFRRHRPDITLMALQIPEVSGVEAILAIRKECPIARIIALTTCSGEALARRAFKAGVTGYLLKNIPPRELLEAIRAVHFGQRKISPEIATQLVEHCCEDALSERELDVLNRVAVGSSNKLVAAQLAITEATVKAHMKNILLKLDASGRTHAVIIAIQRGFLVA